jgi:sugar/nucleoside kinase (ribokinase family)
VSTRLTYSDGGRRVEHQSGSATHDDVSPGPGDLGGVHRVARIVHLTPTPIARQLELVRHVASWSGPSCTVDPHDPVREDSRAAWLEVLALVEGFFPGEDELLLDGAAEDPRTALRRLETPRLELIAFKRGARGGLVWDVETDKFIEWRAGTGRVVDPTGAGDAFVGGFLAGRLRKEEIAASLERGIVAASFAIQDWGARGLLKATPELFERRRAEWFGARTNA